MEQKFREHPNLYSKRSVNGGVQYSFKFDNGYSASVVCHSFSYGNEDGLYELAVITNEGLCYDTEITNDVLGWLTVEDVLSTLERIKKLDQR